MTVFSRFLRLLPHSLTARLPLLVITAFLTGAAVTGWTVANYYQRQNILSTAFSSGRTLLDLVRRPASAKLNGSTLLYQTRLLDQFPSQVDGEIYPLILVLDGVRYRSAVIFDSVPPRPNLLRASRQAGRQENRGEQRLADLSRNIARQDKGARLLVYLDDENVVEVQSEMLWANRYSETQSLLLGLVIFSLLLAATIPLAVSLSRPFRMLARKDGIRSPDDLGALASEEAVAVGDMLRRLQRDFDLEQESQNRSLAAISHDLRTPVTRMRLRAEMIDDETLRNKFSHDLEELSDLVSGALDLLSLGHDPEEQARFSLVTLLESLCDDYTDSGRAVDFQPEATLDLGYVGSVFSLSSAAPVDYAPNGMMLGRPNSLRRAFSNLIDNGLKFGSRVTVSVHYDSAESLLVSVQDNGPGIPDGQMEKMLLPFVRGQRANMPQGSGLGLSIAHGIIHRHGGNLSLTNQDPGLLAQVILPRDDGSSRRSDG
ncbi:sensor histidine kinase [Coralliovum pocilloporae]|uniref:sensor histidine kinase n=1 Tax=Coralliovum pocilloporae TaxID=3066369 RepID=UPI003306C475